MIELTQPAGWPAPTPTPLIPGPAYEPPLADTATATGDVPRIFEHSDDVGPDQSFFVVGDGLSDQVFAWGRDADAPQGRALEVRPHLVDEHYLMISLPAGALEALILVWVGNDAGWSRPLRLNAPQPWWYWPQLPESGGPLRIFGRDLSRRPDRTTAFAYLSGPNGEGQWLAVEQAEKYTAVLRIPSDVEPAQQRLWFHAGSGGRFGWSAPLTFLMRHPQTTQPRLVGLKPPALDAGGPTLQEAIDRLADLGGGVLQLGEGIYPFRGTLRLPAAITLAGQGMEKTRLQLEHSENQDFAAFGDRVTLDGAGQSGWQRAQPGPRASEQAPPEDAAPGHGHAAVWLAGDGAALRDLTISGNPQVTNGVMVGHPKPLSWIADCRIERIRVADLESAAGDISAVRLFRAAGAVVRSNELWGQIPLFLSSVKRCDLSANRLVLCTRFGQNAEAAIHSRNEVLEKCIIEANVVTQRPGARAGAPPVKRLLWVSSGRGSVSHNWFACNGIENPERPLQFGGAAGRDQDGGELILFEAHHRTMYFGRLAGANQSSITLPATLPPTPDKELGSVERDQLARDSTGAETPFWPPAAEDGSPEPPIGQYCASIFQGPGQGQTRRVIGRRGQTLLLERPWRTPPTAESLVAVGTAFYRNLLVGNHAADGLSGIQLRISCIENIIADNTISRMREQGLSLFASLSTLASSMPRTRDRGNAPLFFNHLEGNRIKECNAGLQLATADPCRLPLEFPRALGNVMRHNSLVCNRNVGLTIDGDGDATAGASILGTIVEFNTGCDDRTTYGSDPGSDANLCRRNHAEDND